MGLALKIDLVMWTKNGESTLTECLQSIEKAIPPASVNQKIVIDAHSIDKTRAICERFGWTVYNAETVGIPYQANQALGKVTTEFFASFEQDIIVNHDWFRRIMKHFENQEVAVAQGVRLASHPTLKKIEEYALQREDIGYSSLDNTVYRTKVIRKIGGFSPKHLTSLDRVLQDAVRSKSYSWIVDKTIISKHIRKSLWKALKHDYEIALFSSYLDCRNIINILRLYYSPIRALEISVKKKCPEALFVYPVKRFLVLKGILEGAHTQKRLTSNFFSFQRNHKQSVS